MSLLEVKDQPVTERQALIDSLIEAGELESAERALGVLPDHSYSQHSSDSRLIYYIAGYVARKCVVSSGCASC